MKYELKERRKHVLNSPNINLPFDPRNEQMVLSLLPSPPLY